MYQRCGHFIKPCEIEKAPPGLAEPDMPKDCLACSWSGIMEAEFRAIGERGRIMIEPMTCWPGVFEDAYNADGASLDPGLEEIRTKWMSEIYTALRRLEEEDRRDQW